ncbi:MULTISPECIES: exodeoxyribonuclease V subunit gamma [unclassified Cyanobium]|uniref:exodeoxyribonuclease V subunit gamma n=1 Tax=unclassified Cyanobium TaxID=2627006 RepID=UPI0020CF2B7D|nr:MULTISPECIES: exodeoxyribonuclease V subunit gamma [unclassified Cyanobium]MCP9858974.1 exodeoxyribonuclease V subunit gamma [Cyanobium sp. Cruz-8H5]MCP9866210.1 exodeoxyribonuclease V subunit gamma [Cyanobium sp. Cruz-8D1]
MLTVFRSNRAELLARVLATQLRLQPPDPFEQVQVVVNTWPTSRWLGEQLAEHLGGIAANLRFPFPGSHLRQLVEQLLAPAEGSAESNADPWRADQLVWPLLGLLPAVAAAGEGGPLRHWLAERGGGDQLELGHWQLARAIADAFDDYALYRPELLGAWGAGKAIDASGGPLPENQRWQPLLYRSLLQELGHEPFGRRVQELIGKLRRGELSEEARGTPLRLFGLSSMAPIQVQLLQALSLHRPVDLYLLTPCRDLWQRCGERRRQLSDALALYQPFEAAWLLQAPGLEARFGRLGGEFQQLLEGTGEAQLGEEQEKDLFFAAASGDGPAPLLAQLQEQLADASRIPALELDPQDRSLEFHACPGRLRQVQIVRDRLLQLLAADPSLEPRDILVMTPDINGFAPLVASVFGDGGATGVELPWRLTDRSQDEGAGLGSTLLQLLELAGTRLTASGLETLLGCGPLLGRFDLEAREAARLVEALQEAGFRWGLDGEEKDGACHSLAWAIDRLLLGLVLPAGAGLAPGETAPWEGGVPLELTGRWLHLLGRLRHWLGELRRGGAVTIWVERLRRLIDDLFGDGGEAAGELPALMAAIDAWHTAAGHCPLGLEAPVAAAVLRELLGADSGRFGHRSGALTISALEPMRAIPYRVIVLMGLEAGLFPRPGDRPAFHLMEGQRQLGDPHPADQDRYVLMEALLSARDHLLLSWSCRDDRTGAALPPSGPVGHWLQWLAGQLDPEAMGRLQVEHAANPLDRRNFLPAAGREPSSCDRRLLQAVRLLRGNPPPPTAPLLAGPSPEESTTATDTLTASDAFNDLRHWLAAPQAHWLQSLGLRPGEWEKRIDDLEALCLGERERSTLLRGRLQRSDGDPSGGDPGTANDWLAWHRGEGVLPPGAAADLEAVLLQRRWSSLAAALEHLGPPRQVSHLWGPWQAPVPWRGETVVLVHTAQARVSHRLGLWLQLLLAAAAAGAPSTAGGPARGVLIARDGDVFAPALELKAPTPEAARDELQRLAGLQRDWRRRGWPVPPETGWSFAVGERKRPGQGRLKAASTWEGSGFHSGERERAEMEACFGARLPADALLTPEVLDLADALFSPLLAAETEP